MNAVIFVEWLLFWFWFGGSFALLFRHPERLHRGQLARFLQRRFGIAWKIVDALPALFGTLAVVVGIFSSNALTAAGYAIFLGWEIPRLVTDWLSDDDDRWKRRRERLRNKLKWRMKLPQPQRVRPMPT